MSFSWITGGADILGGLFGSGASQTAANQLSAAEQQAFQEQLALFNQTKGQIGGIYGGANNQLASIYGGAEANLNPYMAAGGTALTDLQRSLGTIPGGSTYQQSPGYGFQMQQGIQAIDNSAAARGGVHGGNTLKSLDQFGQGIANQDYQQYLGNLFNVAGTGLSAAGQFGNLAQGYAGNTANLAQGYAGNLTGLTNATSQSLGQDLVGMGAAQAAGTVGSANALNGMFGGLAQLPWQQMFGGGGSSLSGSFPDSVSV